jgi:hypothetical protein
MDRARLELVIGKLVTVLETAQPQLALPIDGAMLLFQAGSELHALLKEVYNDSPDTADAALAAVIADYAKASTGWDKLNI